MWRYISDFAAVVIEYRIRYERAGLFKADWVHRTMYVNYIRKINHELVLS